MKKTILAVTALAMAASFTPQIAEAETFNYSGGCFWCTEADSEKLKGVSEVISGFTGGTTPSPRYYYGEWGDHREAAQIIYDPAVISYEELVKHVYATIDYEDKGGQFCDRGHSYSPAIYYKTEEERMIAEKLAPKSSIVPIEPESAFFPVREEHQDYYKKNAIKYKFYRYRCGRDARVEALKGE
ncbi:peptide-methionine (S)-S-oxide reductase [Terasakiella sp. A23]|uniref:peptide-methionine (S)-S-oxide reductase n=1 Tax=Terasakiella sp. FCG-A23 TaxID=3080561 RepID=UPI002954FB42|nr:peptide-methionine (S)-S-oxide reductase [Terasakiella sp. A23]MDV7339744.1 peptide-methionine (S)-S-oxide reductase [Terasakiella sp. A23]